MLKLYLMYETIVFPFFHKDEHIFLSSMFKCVVIVSCELRNAQKKTYNLTPYGPKYEKSVANVTIREGCN
jgi:hypothetical protein